MSFDDGFILGCQWGMKKGGGGGGGGDVKQGKLRAVIDNGAGSLKIVSENAEDNTLYDYNYTYDYVIISSSITTMNDEGTETVRRFSQRIITALYNTKQKKILRTAYNTETGKILGFYDGDNNRIHTEEWR